MLRSPGWPQTHDNSPALANCWDRTCECRRWLAFLAGFIISFGVLSPRLHFWDRLSVLLLLCRGSLVVQPRHSPGFVSTLRASVRCHSVISRPLKSDSSPPAASAGVDALRGPSLCPCPFAKCQVSGTRYSLHQEPALDMDPGPGEGQGGVHDSAQCPGSLPGGPLPSKVRAGSCMLMLGWTIMSALGSTT